MTQPTSLGAKIAAAVVGAFVGLCLGIVFGSIAAGGDDKDIARLVKQLGSSDYRTRNAATNRLTAIGEPALDALGKANDTLEMRRRAEAIVAAIEDKLYREYTLIGHSRDPKPEGSDRNHLLPVWTVSVSADGK